MSGFQTSEIVSLTLDALGGHPSSPLGLDLVQARDRGRWLVAARLLSERDAESRVLDAFRRLDASVGSTPGALAEAGPERVAAVLEGGDLRRADAVAHGLVRVGRALEARGPEALEDLAAEALDLEALGSSLAGLAPGFGAATVLRFLRPLRSVWSAARETPLTPGARAAAVHLGLLTDGEDLEGEPAALAAACAGLVPTPALADVEAALERLGARACRSGRSERCPLGGHCPAR